MMRIFIGFQPSHDESSVLIPNSNLRILNLKCAYAVQPGGRDVQIYTLPLDLLKKLPFVR